MATTPFWYSDYCSEMSESILYPTSLSIRASYWPWTGAEGRRGWIAKSLCKDLTSCVLTRANQRLIQGGKDCEQAIDTGMVALKIMRRQIGLEETSAAIEAEKGIRVEVTSWFDGEEDEGYRFAYRVSIQNTSATKVLFSHRLQVISPIPHGMSCPRPWNCWLCPRVHTPFGALWSSDLGSSTNAWYVARSDVQTILLCR